MAPLGWLAARNSRAENRRFEDRALTRENVPAVFLPDVPGGPATADAALQIADVFAAVRLLAHTAATLPLVTYRRTAGNGRERYSGRLADLLANPAPGVTATNLTATLIGHLVTAGNAYLGLFRDGDGQVVQLAPLHPAAISVALEGGEPVYSRMTRTGVQRLTRRDVIHLRALSTDGLVGMSPITQARQALGLADSLAGHAASFAANAARPGGILHLGEHGATREQGAAMRDEVSGRYGGPANAGRIAVVSGGADVSFTQVALSMQDAQWVEQRQLSTQEVARVFGVPASLLGAPTGDSLTYGNRESDAIQFLTFGLRPWLAIVEEAISAHSDLSPGTVFAEYLVDGLLRADSRARAEVYSHALDPVTGWLTRDEVRALENLPAENRPAPEPAEEAPRRVHIN